MRILYGVVGEGMGHATRSRVLLEELIKEHEVQIVVSGRAKDYLAKRSWNQTEVSKVMAWMTDNQANGQDGAAWFLKNMPEVWTKWVPADVAEKIKAAL